MFKKWNITCMIIVLSMGTVLSACSKSEEKAASPSSAVATATATETAAATEVPKLDPMAKYDPPIQLTTVRKTNSGQKYLPGESLDKNIYTASFESDLGIKVVNNWIVDDTQYQQKVNVSIVSNDLPDFLQVDAKQMQTLADGGKLADLTGLYDQYASELVTKIWGGSKDEKLSVVTLGGKLIALPMDGYDLDSVDFLWVRKDWMDKLKLAAPKTMDDVMNIAKAFATQDPDGNGKDDTFGLNMNKNIWDGYSGITGFMNGFGAYAYNPTNQAGQSTFWLKDAAGKLVFADIQPEVKTALGKLQELFKAKAISPEWGIMDGTKASQFETSSKVGMHYGQFWNANWPLADMKKVDVKVDWNVYPLVSVDGQPVKVQDVGYRPKTFMVVNKDAKNPEAVFKLLNYYMEKNYGKTRDEKFHIVTSGEDQINVFGQAPILGYYTDTNQNDYTAVQEALTAQDGSKLNPTAKGYYDNIVKYKAGDVSLWWVDKLFGSADSVYGALAKYKSIPENYVFNEFYGNPTETMVERGSTLKDLEGTVFTKIILGGSLDEFDKFVANWKSQGGDKITQEVNDWYTSINK